MTAQVMAHEWLKGVDWDSVTAVCALVRSCGAVRMLTCGPTPLQATHKAPTWDKSLAEWFGKEDEIDPDVDASLFGDF